MKPKDSQWKTLYQAMRKGRKLTMLDIFKLTGSMNGHKRIRDLEYHVDTVVYRGWRKVGNRRFREYSL